MAYGHECELSDSDHVQHPQDLVLMLGYTYIGTKVQSSRCRLSIFNLFDICHVTRCFAFRWHILCGWERTIINLGRLFHFSSLVRD